ncbi:MAG: 50S ribosomal protein L1 [Gammaproteobacteria bacterium]|nr:50S ribosomal protein L1 [Pseudomonadota bacterium]MCH9663860.1 50S ribosomal protein L1 [Gammaproteobacteria bacterium]
MTRLTKKQKKWAETYDLDRSYSLAEALAIVRKCAISKFKESIECSFALGIDAGKSDQAVRGASVLPHGLGKDVRVAVFASEERAAEATEAGATKVGLEDLAEEVKRGNIDFDVVIATPAAMRIVGQLGQILGPRGLMPNPKLGTVTEDIQLAVKNARSGQVRFRADKGGIVNCAVGKAEFTIDTLRENIAHLYEDLMRAKPATSKGVYFRRLSVSSTMGPGLSVDLSSVKPKS